MSDVLTWIDDHLASLGRPRTGDVETTHAQPWSTVLRVPTSAGPVWFKSVRDDLRHEAAVTHLVSTRVPDRVPPLLGVDTDRGWMLMPDAGRRLREVIESEHSLDRWHDVLEATARIQLATSGDVPALLATGVPHRPLTALPEVYDAFVSSHAYGPRFREATSRVAEQAERLASFGLAETIQHDDLHDGQVFLGTEADEAAGRHLILDWGDACVSHPFFTLAVTLLGVISWGVEDVAASQPTDAFRDSYLGPFATAYDVPVADLVEAADLATRLGWAYRAVTAHEDGDDAATIRRLRLFLDGHL